MKKEKAEELVNLVNNFVADYKRIVGDSKGDSGIVLAMRLEEEKNEDGQIPVHAAAFTHGDISDQCLAIGNLDEHTNVVSTYAKVKMLSSLKEIGKDLDGFFDFLKSHINNDQEDGEQTEESTENANESNENAE